MAKVVTYHAYKSTGLGGVEGLVRELQRLAIKNDFECVELYRDGESKQFYKQAGFVRYERIYPKLSSKIGIILASWSRFRKIGISEGDYIFIFNPIYLVYLPFSVLIRSKVVLVQASALDVIYSRWIVRLILKVYARLLFKLTVYGEQDFNKFVRMFPSLKNKIRVVPRGCKLKTATSSRSMSRNLVSIARIDEKVKNFQIMVRVMQQLGPEYKLDIYGDGSDEEVRGLVQLVSGVDNVNYLGPVSDVEHILKKYSVFLMTSKYEGLGQSVLEARSQGLPAVVFNTFPNAELVVKHGETGFLVPPWSLADYVASIKYLLSDPQLYQSFSRLSLKHAKDSSLDKINELWESQIFFDSLRPR